MAPAPGVDRCRTLVFLFPLIFLPLSIAAAQEAPPAGPPVSSQEAPPGPPVSPPPVPPGLEAVGPGGPIRTFRFAPVLEEIGPLRVQAFLSVEEEFTDNANQQKDNRKSEFRTSIAPGLAAHIAGARTTLDLAYAPRYFLPGNRPEDATLDHNLTFRSSWNPSPFVRLSLAEDLTRSTDFRDVEDPGTRRTGQRAFLRNQGTIQTAYIPPKGRAALSYTNVLVQNDSPIADDSQTHIFQTDGDLTGAPLSLGGTYLLTRGEFEIASPYWEHTIEGRIRRVLTPTISVTLFTFFTHHDEDRGQDFMIGRARLGGIWTLGPNGSLEGGAGANVFAPRDSETTVRPSVLVGWTQRLSLFSLSARYEEVFQERFQQVDNTGVTATRSASVNLAILAFRDLTATLSGGWTENRFEQTTLAGGSAGTRDRTWDVDAGLRYYILRPLSLTLGYTYTIRTSTDPTAEFHENRIRFGLTYQYDIF